MTPGGPPAVALVGPTASGKTAAALAAAEALGDVEVLSIDSMAVYREMDIGTAKPTVEERARVPVHLVDLADPGEDFHVRRFQEAAGAARAQVAARGHRALLVGGTGLYFRAVVDRLEIPGRWPEVAAALEQEADEPGGLDRLAVRLAERDPTAAARIPPGNRRRLVRALEVTLGSGRPFSSYGPGLEVYPAVPVVILGIPFEPAVHDVAIARRFEGLMAAGLLDEVRHLAARPGGLSRTARQALGYRELLAHLEGGLGLEEAVSLAVRRTQAFARRQWSWFRRDPRVRWLGAGTDVVGALADAFGALGAREAREAGLAGEAAARREERIGEGSARLR